MGTHRPIPDELRNLSKPTRADARNSLSWRNSIVNVAFGDTMRGQQCAKGMYGGMQGDSCRQYAKEHTDKQEAAIDDALLTLEHEYQRKLEQRAAIEASNAEALAHETALLKSRYMEQPGATEAGFAAALPDLLEARRRQAALGGMNEVERAMEKMRGNISL
ncbi:MAG: hypothetical protein IT335_00665 [Thermomicrobiales bacterium]|nr:hypothetical protein [Thermomicrobiales bacterium]